MMRWMETEPFLSEGLHLGHSPLKQMSWMLASRHMSHHFTVCGHLGMDHDLSLAKCLLVFALSSIPDMIWASTMTCRHAMAPFEQKCGVHWVHLQCICIAWPQEYHSVLLSAGIKEAGQTSANTFSFWDSEDVYQRVDFWGIQHGFHPSKEVVLAKAGHAFLHVKLSDSVHVYPALWKDDMGHGSALAGAECQ